MTPRKTFDVLLSMYKTKKHDFTLAEREALQQAVETLGAALGLKDWDWGT